MTDLVIKNIDIPIILDKIDLKGSIYYLSNTKAKAPFIVNMGGLLDHRESYLVKFFTEKFANAGYYVLSYDYRGHGETKKQTGSRWDKMTPQIFSDIHIVLEWIIQNQSKRLLENKIALFGRSFGSAITLTHGFIDERAKALIALCTRYDYHTTLAKYPEAIIEKISPKNFLKKNRFNNNRILISHCKDDNRIPFENLYQIKKHLGLNDKNVIIYNSGGHSFKGNREDIFDRSLKFLKKLF